MSPLSLTLPLDTDAVPVSSSDPDEQQQRALLHAFLTTVQHFWFFGNLRDAHYM